MNILIIDDEPLIHISIERLIHKYSEEICVYHAYNGQEMQSILQEHPVVLAYVDIKLPGISGLEAIRLAKEIAPSTTYYIMSSFDKFEYAKEAIKLKVEDYLLKPLDYETIKNTIDTASRLNFVYKKERKTVFRNWLEHILNHHDCQLEQFTDYYYSALLINLDTSDFPQESLIEKLLPYEDSFVSAFTGNHILLLCFSEDSSILRTIQKELASQSYDHGITVFLSSITKEFSEMKMIVENLLTYSSLRVLLGIGSCYSLKPILKYSSDLISFCQLCLNWQTAYANKQYNEFVDQSELICTQLESNPDLGQYLDKIYQYFQITLDSDFSIPESISELRKAFQKYALTFLQSPENANKIHSIIQYIQEHYCENLSVAVLSDRFGLSSNYISNLLKQKLGIRYNDYITQLRIKHAKQLLISTNLPVKKITEACGYYSQSHFTKLFLEYEQCTPLEYRKQNKPN